MDIYSYLSNFDPSTIEDLYGKFRSDPGSVDESWRKFFEGFEFSQASYPSSKSKQTVIPDEFYVLNLIRGYRERGHLFTRTNPVRTRRNYAPNLDPANFGLSADKLPRLFQAGTELRIGKTTLQHIIEHLTQTYCQSIGVEYMYIRTPEITTWMQQKMEPVRNTPSFTRDEKRRILSRLSEAVLFEKFIHKKFPGHKSFGLEGCESLIPALDAIVDKGADLGISEFVVGMAHRGRLNVLAHILRKPYYEIFSEFEGREYEDTDLLGDVKYHLGYSNSSVSSKNTEVRLTLCPNPSHLEAVDPVVEGLARARIDTSYDGDFSRVIPILIHGDASISGQGIIYEVLQMSQLEGYRTGGTIHLVINNQLGFTTNYLDGRSSIYCTDVAKTIQCPIFHVNADDVEAVIYTVVLAMEFRQKFHRDVFIDLLGYRKYGHNESDEPRFTQPVLYKAIEKHPDPLEIYSKKLEDEGILPDMDLPVIKQDILQRLDRCFERSQQVEKANIISFLQPLWKDIRRARPEDFTGSPPTGVSAESISEVGNILTTLSAGVPFFRKLVKLQEERKEMLGNGRFDWAMAELLAYGTLVKEGFPVRISGQDCQRGTFSHRHAVFTIEDSEEKYIPLQHLMGTQAAFSIYNSPLSEYGVLGFEYGYALATPYGLTVWEAQFGDFNNGAQVITDQYISSAEDKWRVMNGLVLLLPHGYEGQGPEHSSARIERFLAATGHLNIQVVNCTTPANFFHVLRRQVHRDIRKPLIVFTPKSLLRHPECISCLTELTSGGFQEVMEDPEVVAEKVTKVVFCSGKIYYDILQKRKETGRDHVTVIRVEQLYPFPGARIDQVVRKYAKATEWEWVQEEPVNMGPWNFVRDHLANIRLQLVARPSSGSTATGSGKLHKIQQSLLAEKALGLCTCEHAYGSCKLECADNAMFVT